MNRVGVALVVFLTLASTAVAQSEVPFRLIDGWAIVVEGTLAGVPQCGMLIDTGAVPSVINRRVAKSMRLVGSAESLSLMNRSVDVDRVRVPRIQLGEIRVEALEMVSADLGRIEQALGIQLDAVVGLDLLARQNFTLDYRHRKLVFHVLNDPASAITFQIKQAGGGIYVVLPLESGGEILEVLLDTGTRDLTIFRSRLRGLKTLRTRSLYNNVNAGGNDLVEEIEIPSVSLGQLRRQRQRAIVEETSGKDVPGFDGLLGPISVGMRTLSFDFDRHLLSFDTR